MDAKNYPIPLNIVLYPCEDDADFIVAHCLEFDVVAVERTKPKAIKLLQELVDDLVEAMKERGSLADALHPAPEKYWKLLAGAKQYEGRKKQTQRRDWVDPIGHVGYAMAL